MKESFRQSMAWLHTWSGLVVSWILFAVFVTGTASYFRDEISLWMRPELFHARGNQDAAAAIAIRELQQRAPTASRWIISLPTAREATMRVSWSQRTEGTQRRARFENALLDPATGAAVNARDTHAGDFFYRFHFQLNMPPRWGRWIVGLCAMFMAVAIVSGVITHKKIFKDFFTFRPNRGQRSWLDAHNALGVLALPYHVMITYTGLITLMFMYMPWGMQAAYQGDRKAFSAEALGSAPEVAAAGRRVPLTPIEPLIREAQRRWHGAQVEFIGVQHPGDAAATIELRRDHEGRLSHNGQPILFNGVTGAVLSDAGKEPPAAATYGVMYGLHTARFSFSTLRWLFFLCGLAGSAMIATGLVLWTVKRAPEKAKMGRVPFGHRLVEVLNIGAITGLPLAIGVYFYANRLLPLEMVSRADAEVRYFFIAWGLCFVVAALLPARQAWRIQLSWGAGLFAGIPLLNALTTQTHLAAALAARHWVYASFDISMFALGCMLGFTAWKFAGQRASRTERRGHHRVPENATADTKRA